MKKRSTAILNRYVLATAFICLAANTALWARAGGGGGGHYSSHSSGGGSHYYGHNYGGGSSGPLDPLTVVIVIIVVILYVIIKSKMGKTAPANNTTPYIPQKPFPDGLDKLKVQTSFIEIQNAWQKKDLKPVRKWISDGVYQRYNTQFSMMNKLYQVNKLSNINISNIQVAKTATDGKYQTADIAISFSMDDEFLSEKYPQFNERFIGDTDTEYWTFIKRQDAQSGKNLYDNNNCPNCGAPFENKMGEISRCNQCGTLTNNASYDWVLSEITQADDYTGNKEIENNHGLHELTQNDSLFSVQRIEDVASNVFMQIMNVLSGAPDKKLARFAQPETVTGILKYKATLGNIVFDRLYLNDVTLAAYTIHAERLHLTFNLAVTYQRVQTGQTLKLIDPQMTTRNCRLVLSKNLKGLTTPAKETVYSYECSNCGAPFDDTTNDVCPYCGSAVIDFDKNWVLTDFEL